MLYVNENTIVEWLGLCAVVHSGKWKLTVVNFNLENVAERLNNVALHL